MRLYDYTASGNCYKVRLLLALLDRSCERVPIDIFAGDTMTDEYRGLNPLRETPVLELDSGEIITQSNAILWYLAEGTPFLPGSTLGRAHVLQWLFFEQERVMSGIGSARFRKMTGRDPGVAAARFAVGKEALAVLEANLAERSFFVGDGCSIADISIFAYTHVAEDAGYELREYPAVCRWLSRVEEQPRFIDDLEPYPDNARPGAGKSIYG
ncbi:MAG TPA: glutathione S-transferase family protein [Gemmatimonadota bacterium]|nr:glutathione S-transferase family protein [Gemmatimonadota bacterium]